jgi:hypothetical protein
LYLSAVRTREVPWKSDVPESRHRERRMPTIEPPEKRESALKRGYATAKIREGNARVNYRRNVAR